MKFMTMVTAKTGASFAGKLSSVTDDIHTLFEEYQFGPRANKILFSLKLLDPDKTAGLPLMDQLELTLKLFDTLKKSIGDAWRAARPSSNFFCRPLSKINCQEIRRPANNTGKFLFRIKIESHHNAESIAEW